MRTKPNTLRNQRRPLTRRGFFIFVSIVLIGISVLLLFFRISPTTLFDLLQGDTTQLRQHEGRTNIVLFGMGGEEHEGGDLTDTLMVASVGLTNKDVVLVSLPRDIWIPTLKDRINAAYRIGEEKQPGSGLTLAKSAVEEVVGIPIHYGVLIDFAGFKRLVDVVGGIDVEVAQAFIDPLYPIPGRENEVCGGDPTYACRYETISFSQGTEHMDGDRALKFVRSRHADGEAGNDFSRGQRQQAVIVALRNKLLSLHVLTNLETLGTVKQVVTATIRSDMETREALLLGRSLEKGHTIKTYGLTQDEPEKDIVGLLINPPLWQYEGAWVLVPKHEDFEQINLYVQCVIEGTSDCEELLE